MRDASEYIAAWDADNTVPFPREAWMEVLPAPAESYPAIDFLPIDMSAVYTSYVVGEVQLYDQVDVQIGDRQMRFMLIGAVPADAETWFVFQVRSGEVMMLDIEESALELVNSSFANFVEFLFHFGHFVDADTGGGGRAARAAALREQLESIDPAAFEDPESWWSAVFLQLKSAG